MPSDAMDWIAIGLMLFIVVGILGAFFLYLRTSYRKGGWERVRTDFMIAIVALLVWAAVRICENHEIQKFKHAVERGFR
jgi:heme/copper-type cytochrome/quinol oxidase subunit 4